MEDVLRVYERPRDPARPLVCLDESSRQLVAHSREPLPPRPGEPGRWDYEYVRNGVADIFMCFAPLLCKRHVRVTKTRCANRPCGDPALGVRRPVPSGRAHSLGMGQPQHALHGIPLRGVPA